jgi:GH15 family glucan-1,4-alpha-glucosidase
VRIGNDAARQFQLDITGDVMDAVYLYNKYAEPISHGLWGGVRALADWVCENWREPDEGIWEVRGGRHQFSFSKLMCWVALDRLLALDETVGLRIARDKIGAERAAIRAWIEREGWNDRVGAFVGEPGTDAADAALLTLARFGFLDARDERMSSTFEYVDRRLGNGPLLYRYVPGTDSLPGREGAFGIASFWAVDYLARAGRIAEAESRFAALLAHANDVGLLAEELDPRNGAQLGNFPQAYTHVGLIAAAVSLRRVVGGTP